MRQSRLLYWRKLETLPWGSKSALLSPLQAAPYSTFWASPKWRHAIRTYTGNMWNAKVTNLTPLCVHLVPGPGFRPSPPGWWAPCCWPWCWPWGSASFCAGAASSASARCAGCCRSARWAPRARGRGGAAARGLRLEDVLLCSFYREEKVGRISECPGISNYMHMLVYYFTNKYLRVYF